MIQCAQYRRIGDAPSSILRERIPPVAMERERIPPVAMENHSSPAFDMSRSLPQVTDYRLEKKDIDGSMNQSDWNESKGKPGTGKRAPGEKTKPGNCKVCGDDATGMYFGALVCVPCKVGSISKFSLFCFSMCVFPCTLLCTMPFKYVSSVLLRLVYFLQMVCKG